MGGLSWARIGVVLSGLVAAVSCSPADPGTSGTEMAVGCGASQAWCPCANRPRYTEQQADRLHPDCVSFPDYSGCNDTYLYNCEYDRGPRRGTFCADLQFDENNCGACGVVCNGLCEGGRCLDLNTDWHNCGGVGTECSAGQLCCSGHCIEPIDTSNCGACGYQCSGSQPACVRRDTSGAYACTDLATDYYHCGAVDQACGANEECCAGACVAHGQLLRTGDACVRNGDCCSATCSNGRCQ